MSKNDRKWLLEIALTITVGVIYACSSGDGGGGNGGGGDGGPPPSSEKAITTFAIIAPPSTGLIDETAKSIDVLVPPSSSLTALVAGFTVSAHASVTVGSIPQVSGSTPNDFTNPVVYKVTAQDGSTVSYTANVRRIDFYVDVMNGVDTNNGTSATAGAAGVGPVKSLTKGLELAKAKIQGGAVSALVKAAPGTYSSATETFPLMVTAGISLVGDVANKGLGTTATVIDTVGADYTVTSGVTKNTVFAAAIVMAPGENESISGFKLTGTGTGGLNYGIVAETATHATIASNTFLNPGYGIVALSGTTLTVLSNDIYQNSTFAVAVEAEDNNTNIKVRRNNLNAQMGNLGFGVMTGNYNNSNAGIDLGTSADPGNNSLATDPANARPGLALMGNYGGPTVYSAVGNTWKASTQSADANGKYPGTLAANPVVDGANGANFRVYKGMSLQF